MNGVTQVMLEEAVNQVRLSKVQATAKTLVRTKNKRACEGELGVNQVHREQHR